MKNIADLQLRFAYHQFIVRYPESSNSSRIDVPIPNQWITIQDNPTVIPEGRFFQRYKTREQVVKAIGRSFPIEDTFPNDLIYSHIFNELPYFSHNAQYKLPEIKTVEECIEKGLSFTYPIYIWDKSFWESKPWNLPVDLQDYIQTGKVKVVFILEAEGDAFSDSDADWLNSFADKNGLTPETFTYYTNNFIFNDLYQKYIDSKKLTRRLSILCHNEFETNPWFIDRDWTNPHDRWDQNERIERLLHNNRSNRYEKYFLCYQRRPRLGRILMYGLIKINPKLKDKTTISLGALEPGDLPEHLLQAQKHSVNIANQFNKKVAKYIKELDIFHHRSISENLEQNLASSFIEQEHSEHFLSIVSETHLDNKTLFFSEKIWKPIYACQPFILFGNPHSLKKLHELGYRTFSDFWDESYDEIENMVDRLVAIEKVLEEIASWPPEKLREVRFQMHNILEHNINRLKNLDNYYSYLFSLQPSIVSNQHVDKARKLI